MSSDHEAEIRASVGAHADLGPDYDDGVAEGHRWTPMGGPGGAHRSAHAPTASDVRRRLHRHCPAAGTGPALGSPRTRERAPGGPPPARARHNALVEATDLLPLPVQP